MSKCSNCGGTVSGSSSVCGACIHALGAQPNPTPNNNPHIVELVKADLDRRRALGIQRYGTALQASNGRDALKDAYEEALDLCQYLKQALVERDSGEVTP